MLLDNPCVDALYATPFCVDSTWVLWNTTAGDLFCCLQGQTGTNDMQCVNAETDLVASLSASKVNFCWTSLYPRLSDPCLEALTVSRSGTLAVLMICTTAQQDQLLLTDEIDWSAESHRRSCDHCAGVRECCGFDLCAGVRQYPHWNDHKKQQRSR